MDPLHLPSLDLDEILKLDSMMPLVPGMASHGPMSFPLLDDFDFPPLSPTGIVMPPVVGLPGDAGGPRSIPTSEGSGGSGGTDSPTALGARPAADPKERVRAKNRRAQSRYREKQKNKRKETEDALDQITADVERLQMENARLGSSVQLMEQVLSFRDKAASIIDASKREEDKLKGPTGPSRNILKKLLPSAPGTVHGADCTPKISEITEDASIPNAHGVETIEPCCPMNNLNRSEILRLKAIGDDELQARYLELSTALNDSITELNDPRSSEHTKDSARSSMLTTLIECGCLCFEYAVLKPTAMQNLLAVSVGDELSDEQSSSEKWMEITRSLELTDEQADRLQPLRDVYVQRAKRIGARRRQVLASLQAHVPKSAGDDGVEDLKVLNTATMGWLEVHSATAELEASLQEEHVASMEFVAKTFGGVLTPIQKAKAIVASAPAFPDVFAIAVAADKLRQKRLEV